MQHFSELASAARADLHALSEIANAYRSPSLTAAQRRQKEFQAVAIPPGFARRVDLRYSGPAVHAAQVLAMLSGYRFIHDGRGAPPTLWANIALSGQPLVEALRELGAQTGDLAEIQVYPQTQIIRFQVL